MKASDKKNVVYPFRISTSLMGSLKIIAKKKDRSVAYIMNEILEVHIKKNKNNSHGR